MTIRRWRIGTRGSALALWQAHFVQERLAQADPSCFAEVEVIKTSGDLIQDRALLEVGGKGLFVKEIQTALLEGKVDLAVHSLKDYPAENPKELVLACVPERQDRRDALVMQKGQPLSSLPVDAVVATGSLRRRHQAKLLFPRWEIAGLRGNVDTRLKKLDAGQFNGILLASAGLRRLGYDARIGRYFEPNEMVPAVGQGAIAVECRANDKEMRALLGRIESPKARREVEAERRFLRELGGNCTTPLGITAIIDGDKVELHAFLASIRGERHLKDHASGAAEKAESLALELLKRFWGNGASELLERE